MSLSTYPNQKPSGYSWIGSLPSHWTVARLRRSFRILGGATPQSDRDEFWDGDVVWVTPADLGKLDGLAIDQSMRRITDAGLASCSAEVLPAGSIIVSNRAPIGAVALASVPVCTNQGCKGLVPLRPLSPRFYAYYLLSSVIELNVRGRGSTFLELSAEELGAFPAPVPSNDEQTAIVAFLDRETGKIDALVAEQERLIALLKEKRQALISHAVTKGLDPNVPMRDSGVEWLGQVPAHWGVTRLKYATDVIVDCPHETPTYDDDGDFFVVRTADVDEGRLAEEQMRRVAEAEYRQRVRRSTLQRNDVVYGREGERWGHAALIPVSERYCLGQRMMQFRACMQTSAEFLMWQLNSQCTYRQGYVDTVGATSPHVNVSTIRNFALARPPLGEQRAIASFIGRASGSFDELVDQARSAVGLLQERRSALISAAVTGKIDVRGLVA